MCKMIGRNGLRAPNLEQRVVSRGPQPCRVQLAAGEGLQRDTISGLSIGKDQEAGEDAVGPFNPH